MVKLSTTAIDELCERFDAAWSTDLTSPTSDQSTTSGTDGIANFLLANGNCHKDDARILVELIKVDCERSWMAWDKTLPKLLEARDDQEILRRFLAIPRIESYRQLFVAEQDFLESIDELVECEWQCRNLWGDAVGGKHYQQLSPNHSLRESARLRRMRFDFDGRSSDPELVFPLRGNTIFGRQRSSDASGIFFVEGEAENRIIIANRWESEISRTQMALQLLNPNFAYVSNLSEVNPLQIPDRLLECGEGAVLAFPFAIRLPRRRLYFF